MVCSVKDCSNRRRSKKCLYCEKHYCRLRRNGSLSLKPRAKVRQDLFSTIDDTEAWILGLIWSDGSLSGNRITITAKNRNFLMKVNRFCQGNKLCVKPKSTGGYNLAFSDKSIAKRLRDIGCMENKSFSIRWPKINPKFEWSFLRGVFDGDGSVSYLKKSDSLSSYICTASLFFAESICEFYRSQNLNFSFHTKPPKKKHWSKLYVVNTSHASSLKLYENFYKDTQAFMKRKKKVFEKGLRPIKKSGRKKGYVSERRFLSIESDVIDHYLNIGKSIEATGKHFEINETTVLNILKRNNIQTYSGRNVFERMSESDINSILLDRNSGMTFKDLQSKYSLGRSTIRKILRSSA